MEKLACSAEEAAQLAGISRAKLYPLLMSGEIPSIKIGKSRRVLVDDLKKWLQAQRDAQAS